MTNKLYEIDYLNNKDNTKFTVKNIITKFLIYMNIKYNSTIKIICAWDTNSVNNINKYINNSIIFIDYSKEKREWYIYYNDIIHTKKYNVIIDDITGHISS